MPTLVIDQKPFHFENLDDSLTATIIDALSRNLVTPSQIYDILKIIDTKSNYIYIEQLLQETRKINQFTNNKDTYYLLALYIEITIAKLNNYTNNINEIFKTNDFKPLLGYYFIYQKKDTHNLLKNDTVSLLGKKVLKPESDLLAWINGDESLYTKIKEKYPRAAVFDNQFACMENEIMNIKVNNATDEYIEELVTLANTYNSESFRSDVNFYIGQIYHKRKDYINASKYYSKSYNENAIYNLMRITREIKDENEKYSKITNYIKLINGRTDFVEPLSSVCSLRLSERWCGNALLAYYKAEGISDELRTINLSYFYYKCLEDSEIEIINQFYELIKDKKFEKHDTPVIFGIDTPEVRFCTDYIVDELYKLGTDLAKYNLSFFVAKQSAVEVLNTILTKNENVLSQLAVLTNCLDTIKEIIPLNKLLSQMLMSNYYFKTNNLSHAKDILMNMNDDYADSQLAYIQYQQYRKNYNEEFLGRMLKYLKNYQNIYVVYLVAVYLYEKRFVKKCCNLLKEMIIELEKERNVYKRNLLNNCYTLMAFCYLYNKEYREGMEYLDKSKNKDMMIKVASILSNK